MIVVEYIVMCKCTSTLAYRPAELLSLCLDRVYTGELHGQDSEHTHHFVSDVRTNSWNLLLSCSGECWTHIISLTPDFSPSHISLLPLSV